MIAVIEPSERREKIREMASRSRRDRRRKNGLTIAKNDIPSQDEGREEGVSIPRHLSTLSRKNERNEWWWKRKNGAYITYPNVYACCFPIHSTPFYNIVTLSFHFIPFHFMALDLASTTQSPG
jgi:hypothetical protein